MFFKVAYGQQIHMMNCKSKTSLSELKKFIILSFKKIPQHYSLSYIDQDGDEISITNDDDFRILQENDLKSIKIYLKETTEDFFDVTQEVILQEDQMEENKPVNLPVFDEIEPILKFQEPSETLDDTISEKLKQALPDVISKVKQEMLKESQLKNSKIQEIQKKVVHHHIICDGCGVNPIQGIRYKCAVCADFDLCEKCEAKLQHQHPFLKIKTLKQTPFKIIAIVNDQNSSLEINGQKVNVPGINQIIDHGLKFAERFIKPSNCGKRNSKQCHKKETNFEKKTDQKTEVSEKVEKKLEQKNLKEEKKSVFQPHQEPKMNREQKLLDNACYLADVLDIEFARCYKFVQKNIYDTREELFSRYFANPKLI